MKSQSEVEFNAIRQLYVAAFKSAMKLAKSRFCGLDVSDVPAVGCEASPYGVARVTVEFKNAEQLMLGPPTLTALQEGTRLIGDGQGRDSIPSHAREFFDLCCCASAKRRELLLMSEQGAPASMLSALLKEGTDLSRRAHEAYLTMVDVAEGNGASSPNQSAPAL